MRSACIAFPLLIIQGLLAAACGSSSTPSLLPTAATPVVAPVPVASGLAVTGRVYDTAYRPLAGATVQVLDGPHAGMSTTAGANGQFFLQGEFDGATRFRATKEGHADGIATMSPACPTCSPQHWLYFYLALPVAPADVAGDYVLTVVADGSCSMLPEEFRTRTYTAKVVALANQPTPANTRFSATIAGPQMVSGLAWPDLWIAVAGNYLELSVGDGHGQPGLLEQVGADTYVAFGGWGTTTVVDTARVSTITANLDGEMDYCTLRPGVVAVDSRGRYACDAGQAVARASCVSRGHQLILRRQ